MAKTKIIGYIIAVILCFSALQTIAVAAEKLVPGGMTVGLELSTPGVMISQVTEVETETGKVSPARDAGLEVGDCIVKIGSTDIETGAEFIDRVAHLDENAVSITFYRGEKLMQKTITPVKSAEGVFQLGLWLRDGASGIGTVTYFDPETGAYGALGHGISDADNGLLLPLNGGYLCESVVVDVIEGKNGTPGELCGLYDSEAKIGVIDFNTHFGIFGVMSDIPEAGELVEVASFEEVVIGEATILSNIKDSVIEEYTIEIVEMDIAVQNGKNFVIKITDEELLANTGGIVQGMSGSPILQNGKLVGAVTHVLVNDPSMGYGIFIENMLESAESIDN